MSTVLRWVSQLKQRLCPMDYALLHAYDVKQNYTTKTCYK